MEENNEEGFCPLQLLLQSSLTQMPFSRLSGPPKQINMTINLTFIQHGPFLHLAQRIGKEGEAEQAKVDADSMRHIVKYNSHHHGNWVTERISGRFFFLLLLFYPVCLS